MQLLTNLTGQTKALIRK
ncbi:uncharacterized protein FFNC_11753 [Fusarium fujikuroi]|nr:uncharacterized protein FFNC_11753 [Fusarium fujikuroi]